MLELSKANPAITQIAGDLIVKNMDWPGAAEIAERLKKTVPPNLIDDPKAKNQQVPPQVQQQMQQMGQMVDQLTQQLHAVNDDLDKQRLELESKERIEMAKIKRDIEIAMAQMGSKESLALLHAELAQIEARMQLLHVDQPIEDLSPEQPNFAPEADGGPMPADVGQDAIDPTGGASPGLPMEQSNDDPSNF
jgi:TolA-binding protein